MIVSTTLRLKNVYYELSTEWANRYNLSRSTIINVCVAKLSKSKYKERFIKQGITRNTNGSKTKTTWNTTTNLLNLVKLYCQKYNTNYSDIILAALAYVSINSKKPKYLDYCFKRIVERNKNKWQRKQLM